MSVDSAEQLCEKHNWISSAQQTEPSGGRVSFSDQRCKLVPFFAGRERAAGLPAGAQHELPRLVIVVVLY